MPIPKLYLDANALAQHLAGEFRELAQDPSTCSQTTTIAETPEGTAQIHLTVTADEDDFTEHAFGIAQGWATWSRVEAEAALRERFEAWALDQNRNVACIHGDYRHGYEDQSVELAWRAVRDLVLGESSDA